MSASFRVAFEIFYWISENSALPLIAETVGDHQSLISIREKDYLHSNVTT